MLIRFLAGLIVLALIRSVPGDSAQQGPGKADVALRARIGASPRLPFDAVHLKAKQQSPAWATGPISGLAVDSQGNILELQRGDKAQPLLVIDREGRLLRSWGDGDFRLPHSIRIDPDGYLWTVDAGSSTVIKYSPDGKKLMSILVGGRTNNGSSFNGTTDIAFAPNGRIFIADGYSNARILEYSRLGERLKQWGEAGSKPGEFRLPHSIQISKDGVLYVADRENGRIEEFDLRGRYIGEIPQLGRIYSIKLAGSALWASMEPFNEEPGSGSGWVVKLDRKTGTILGHLDVPGTGGGHAMELLPSGEPIVSSGNELLLFRVK